MECQSKKLKISQNRSSRISEDILLGLVGMEEMKDKLLKLCNIQGQLIVVHPFQTVHQR